MATYLITGGAGFIGSHIAEKLLAEGCGVRILDDLSTGQRENLEILGPEVEFFEASILDADAVLRAADGVDGIFHEAARPSVPRSVEDPVGAHECNVTGTMNVLNAARANSAKVVYAGSSSAYGDSETLPKHEGMIASPLSPYAASKLAGEHYLQSFASVYGMQTVTLRYFNVFGPRQRADSPYSGVIAKFCQNALQGETCTIHGDGQQSRDFTYVADVARGNLMAMRADLPGYTVMNLAGGNRFSLLQLVDAIGAACGIEVAREFGPSRAGDVRDSQAAVSRAAELIGFRTEIDFTDGLRKTIDWYREGQGASSPAGSATNGGQQT